MLAALALWTAMQCGCFAMLGLNLPVCEGWPIKWRGWLNACDYISSPKASTPSAGKARDDGTDCVRQGIPADLQVRDLMSPSPLSYPGGDVCYTDVSIMLTDADKTLGCDKGQPETVSVLSP